jgi:hypothetical protein
VGGGGISGSCVRRHVSEDPPWRAILNQKQVLNKAQFIVLAQHEHNFA